MEGLPRPHRLIMSVRDCTRPMSKAVVTFFVWHLIKITHQGFPDQLASLLIVRAHEVWSVTTSHLWNTNGSLSCDGGSLLENTFDLCQLTTSGWCKGRMGTFGLGPVIMAGGIVPWELHACYSGQLHTQFRVSLLDLFTHVYCGYHILFHHHKSVVCYLGRTIR